VSRANLDHDKYRALYTLGSTMTFNTLIDADRLSNLALSMLVEFTAARRGHLVLFDDQGAIRHRFGLEMEAEFRPLDLPAAVSEALMGLKAWDGARDSREGRALSVPLQAEEAMVGALHLERDSGDHPFGPADRALVEACANHLAQSLRSRQLYEAHLAQRRRIELLDRVTRAVNAPADLEDVLALVVRTAAEALSAASGALILGDTAGRLGVASSYRMREDLISPEARPAESRMVRWVFTEGTPMCDGRHVIFPVRHVLRDKRIFGERRRSIHASPFVRTLGVLYIESPLERHPFTEDDLLTLGVFSDHAATAIANNALFQEASTDSLTRLDSRRQLEVRLAEEMDFARRHGVPLSLIMLDVDHFKTINDGHGHQAGDEVLVEIARIVRETVRKYDVCARYGGEEFTVLLPETHLAGAQVVAENVRRRVEGALFSRERVPVTVSLGIAEFPLHASTADGLVRKADRALYDAKAAGRNCHRTAPPI
jgi:diguanylate cyclase (GGDEF)-like protein